MSITVLRISMSAGSRPYALSGVAATTRSPASAARPSGTPDRSALPVAGDDAHAKQQATELLDVLGYDAVDIGTLADSWRSGPNTALYGFPYPGRPPAGLDGEELRHWAARSPGVPVSAQRVKELAATAVRGPAGASYA